MVALNRNAWNPQGMSQVVARRNSAIGRAVRQAAQEGNLAELESLLDLRENRRRRAKRVRHV
jgi:hypothetical protein